VFVQLVPPNSRIAARRQLVNAKGGKKKKEKVGAPFLSFFLIFSIPVCYHGNAL
jgi:hypothetical protein